MHPMLNIASHAARKAGWLITKYYEMIHNLEINSKNRNSFLDKTNNVIEENIIEIIQKFYPKHFVYSEKHNEKKNINQDVQWIIKAVDGVNNFIKSLPHFSVSIAVRIKNRTEIAVIYDPIRNELFTASRGQGSRLNGYRLRGGKTNNLDDAIIAIGSLFKDQRYFNEKINILNQWFSRHVDFRRLGSSSLDLAYVASGRIDGYFETDLKLRDFAAGDLVAREAGVLVCDFNGSHDYAITGNIVSGNPKIVKAILNVIRNKLSNHFKS